MRARSKQASLLPRPLLFTNFLSPSFSLLGGDQGLRELSRVLDGGAPVSLSLQHLHLNDCDVGAEGIAWLGGSLARGSLSKLEGLSVARNEGVGEEGVRYLVRVLKEMGVGCQVKMIDLRWTGMGVGGAGTWGLGVVFLPSSLSPSLPPSSFHSMISPLSPSLPPSLLLLAQTRSPKPWKRAAARTSPWWCWHREGPKA